MFYTKCSEIIPFPVLVKGSGYSEHHGHVCDALDCPIADVLVKGRGVVEHPVHRRDAGGVPRADVLVEGRSR